MGGRNPPRLPPHPARAYPHPVYPHAAYPPPTRSRLLLCALAVLVTLGCNNAGPADSAAPLPQDEPLPVDEPSSHVGTWTLSDPETCAAPIEAHWTDRSDLVWNGEYYPEHGLGDSACVAFEQVGADWRVWATGYSPLTEDGEEPPLIPLLRVDLATGERTVYSVPHLYQRFVVDDFDGDGQEDFGTFLGGLTVLWGGSSEPVVIPDAQTSFTYAALDLDGDTLVDLVATGGGDAYSAPPSPQVFHNLGDRVFDAPVSAATGGVGQGFASQVIDWDLDGDPDVYQCNDAGGLHGPNVVLLDEDGTLTVGDARGADVVAACMSASFGDVDGDGTLDIYIAQVGPQSLLLDKGEAGFVDAAAVLITLSYAPEQMGWSSVTVDADNDARPDIIVTSADFAHGDYGLWPVWFLHQQEDGTFVDAGAGFGMPQESQGRGLVLRDINGDGVVDVLIADVRREPSLLLSDGCTEGAWVEITAPVGSRVTVEAGDRQWAALVSRQDGWCGWGPPTAHIGLGDTQQIDRITITAPWSPTATITDVPARTRVTWQP